MADKDDKVDKIKTENTTINFDSNDCNNNSQYQNNIIERIPCTNVVVNEEIDLQELLNDDDDVIIVETNERQAKYNTYNVNN